MKKIITLLIVFCSGLLAASTCFAQMYTVTDLGVSSRPTGINLVGQVVGNLNGHAYLWTQTNGFQDLGMLVGGTFSHAAAINDFGVVTGTADGVATVISTHSGIPNFDCSDLRQPFVWTQGNGMQGLGGMTFGFFNDFYYCRDIGYYALDINNLGQVVGETASAGTYQFALAWTSAEGMRLFGSGWPTTSAYGINSIGQIVGQDSDWYRGPFDHAALWTNGVVNRLPTLAGTQCDFTNFYSENSSANDINDLGQIVGSSITTCTSSASLHAVLWPHAGGIRDLGTLVGDTSSEAWKVNFYGQVIGSSANAVIWSDEYHRKKLIGRPFLWSESGGMTDLNTLIPSDSGWVLNSAGDINAWGQIVGEGVLNGEAHGFLLNPIYKGVVTPPINSDGTSVFSAKRGVIPIKFSLTQYDVPTCRLQPATIFVTRTAGGTLGAIDESTYVASADSGSDFRINGCQYIYNLAASSLGIGKYRIDISTNGIVVGHAVFALK